MHRLEAQVSQSPARKQSDHDGTRGIMNNAVYCAKSIWYLLFHVSPWVKSWLLYIDLLFIVSYMSEVHSVEFCHSREFRGYSS